MAVTMDVVRMFDAYTRWADTRCLDALGGLPEEAWLKDVGGSFGSIRNTAVHLVSAQAVSLSRWLGRPVTMWKPEEVPTSAALRARWEEVVRDRGAFLADQTDATLAQDVRYTTADGKSYATPLGEFFLHMANHSTYHRGQLSAFLRNVGVKPPSTDFIVWIRSGKP
ncbi:MAG TPA: DinB family protein [Planctomycetota bacterium]